MTDETASACRVCGGTASDVAYEGPVRLGGFGRSAPGVVRRCRACGTEALEGPALVPPEHYATSEYRTIVGEGTQAADFFKLHDGEQFAKVPFLANLLVRGHRVADIGCAAGSFLDMVSGLAGATIAIEPARSYHDSLRERGHEPYPDIDAAMPRWGHQVDLAVSFSVIEHVDDPVGFLAGIRRLVKPGGALLVSTPNLRDVLMQVGGPAYRGFFYRHVHRFYFEADSLATAMKAAGFEATEVRYHHRFGLANFSNWLRDGRPTGNTGSEVFDPAFDASWKLDLEARGLADYLYVTARAV
ncbi:MAG: class I SAM-dependent methyltransferase [Vicinamibacterales bacterium]